MQELEKILEEIEAEFDRRINTQLKIMAGLGDDVYRYGYGKSLEAYQQGKLLTEDIIRKHMNDGWIPVEKRLPEKKDVYLVTYHPCYWDNVHPDIAIGIDTFRGKTTWAKKKFQKVIAWKPLPEPYCPEMSEEE